jgi:transmembrane sensor
MMNHRKKMGPVEHDFTPELTEALADWRHLGRLSDDEVQALRTRRRRVVAGAASGVVAVLLAVGLPHVWPGRSPDRVAALETGRGETRAVRLADGTMLRLDGATRLVVRFGETARHVTLSGGAAFFDVAHDPARPFTVHAGDGMVRVLGTAFNVDRTVGRMDVAVYRGAVRLAGRGDARGRWVSAGWRGHVVRGHASPAVRFDARVDDARQGWLDVDALRLGDLVAILNRRSGPIIQSPPARLANLPISGRFRIDDARVLLQSLGMSYGFVVTETSTGLALSSK